MKHTQRQSAVDQIDLVAKSSQSKGPSSVRQKERKERESERERKWLKRKDAQRWDKIIAIKRSLERMHQQMMVKKMKMGRKQSADEHRRRSRCSIPSSLASPLPYLMSVKHARGGKWKNPAECCVHKLISSNWKLPTWWKCFFIAHLQEAYAYASQVV